MNTQPMTRTNAIREAAARIAPPTLAAPGPTAEMRQYRLRYPVAGNAHREYLGTHRNATNERTLRIAELAAQLCGLATTYSQLRDEFERQAGDCTAAELLKSLTQ